MINNTYTSKKKTALDKKRQKVLEEYKKLLKKLKDPELERQLLSLDDAASKSYTPFTKSQLQKMEKALNKLLPLAAFCKDFKSVMSYIKDELALVQLLQKSMPDNSEKKRKEAELRKIEDLLAFNQEKYDQRLRDFQEEVERINQEKEIFKSESQSHRTEFRVPHNAVHSTSTGDFEAMSKPFGQLLPAEKTQIADFIRENARKFKTKLSSNVRTDDRRRLDMAETCKKACGTGGIPMRLCFKKRKPDQANLLLVLDVSGSCKNASEMMLTLMYYLKDAFPGGCSTFAFTNHLYDISEHMDRASADSAVETALEAIPRRGVYSDYNTPLQELYSVHMPKINQDTIIIFIGDARNNKNPSGEDYLKALVRKSRHAYWFNTEPQYVWDTGDSIMGVYSQYMRMVGEVQTTAQLVNFLMEVK